MLILSGHEDPLLLARAVQAGAVGLLRKTDTVVNVASSVRRAYRGEPIHDQDKVDTALRRLGIVATRMRMPSSASNA